MLEKCPARTEMRINERVNEYVDVVDEYSGNRMRRKHDVATLMQISEDGGYEQVFEDLIFQAKFLSKLFTVVKRTDPGTEAFPKLQYEFKEAVERVGTLVRAIVKESEETVKTRYTSEYFGMNHTCLNNLLDLSYDLSWIKNWKLDRQENRQN